MKRANLDKLLTALVLSTTMQSNMQAKFNIAQTLVTTGTIAFFSFLVYKYYQARQQTQNAQPDIN
jgi:hypothetical protein